MDSKTSLVDTNKTAIAQILNKNQLRCHGKVLA